MVMGLKSRQGGALICFAFAVSVAFAAQIVVVAPHAVAQTGGQAEWQRVLQAARKESKLVAGIPTSPELRKGLEKVFDERFNGIRLELVAGPAQVVANRIVSVP